jgi:hypothetical protein
MDHHLAGEEPGNRRNGYGKKICSRKRGKARQVDGAENTPFLQL